MNKTKVLIVDDDLLLGNIIKDGLELLDYEVEYASALYGLTALVQDYEPDIIFLDYQIKEIQSTTIMPELKLICPNVPVVFISSHIDAEYQKYAIEAGAENYLKKPVTASELDIYIKKYLNQLEIRQELNFGNCTLNTKSRVLRMKNEEDLQLSNYECRILALLIIKKNTTVTLEELQRAIWGKCQVASSKNSLYNYIVKLRKILKSDNSVQIESVNKLGYRLHIE